MQRLILEADASDFVKLTGDKTIEKIKALEVLNFIKQDLNEFVVICSVEFKSPKTRLDEVFNEPGSEFQVLDRSKGGKYTVLSKSKAQSDPRVLEFWSAGGYLLPPLEIKNGRVRMTFMGNAKQVRILPEMLRRAGVRYKVLFLNDASLSPISPLGRLTEKQRRVLTTAYDMGYYDLPRKICSRELAKSLNIGSSDFVKHRRKAEKHLLSAVFNTPDA
jgi:predicted DNA binding protein